MLMLDPRKPLGGRFALEREVGRGGVGVVYRARDLESDRPVALKVVAAEAGVAPDDEERLRREGELLQGLRHPGIVRVVASGFLDREGLPFVAMEWLDGEDLSVRHRRQPLSVAETVTLGALVARALRAAHDAGVVHRDIKPGNILLRQGAPDEPRAELDVDPVLVDFGVAMRMQVGKTGEIVGTPAYMAPEQARGSAVIDGRADLYSLGATLFELLAGRPPHLGSNALATLARVATTAPPSLRELGRAAPPLLDSLIQRLLRTDPTERPSSAWEVEEELWEALAQCDRLSWNEAEQAPIPSGTTTRLVNTLVALHFGSTASRDKALDLLRARSADSAPLGEDALVAHLGARRALGNEADVALELGRRLAEAGARVGIASGRARVDQANFGETVQPLGEVVDRAAALAREAAPGSARVDASTRELGRGGYEFIPQPGGVAILGPPLRGARHERTGGAPFLGRESELAQISSAFEHSLLSSTPLLVSVTGPPGIGKSRLRREILSRFSSHADTPEIIVQRSEAYARAHALGAAADVLRALIALPKGASLAEAESALESHWIPPTASPLAPTSPLATTSRQLLVHLLASEPVEQGPDPSGSRDALWLAMTDLVLRHLAERPLIVALEDLQWADPESIGWFDHLLGRAVDLPLIVFTCVRPSFWTEHAHRFAGKNHLRLDLRPLSDGAARGIAAALLGDRGTPEVLGRIARQAAGSPLFAEELARLTASGRDPTNALTIEAAIQVSLDALDAPSRRAVGRLSVLGLSCWESAFESLGIEEGDAILSSLSAAKILVRQPSSRFPGTAEWAFQHALVRDVAYHALDDEERRELHAIAGEWLASMGEDAAIVAAHFDQGGRQETAADYWERAAHRALTANALHDALSMAERALAFAPDGPTAFRRAMYLEEAWTRLDPRASDRESAICALEDNVYDEASHLRARGARARYDDARGSGEGVSTRLAAVCSEAERLHLHEEVARCAASLAARFAFAGQFEDAEREARRLLELSVTHDLKSAAVDGYQTLAVVRQTQGALIAALDARRNAVTAARAAGLKEREAMLTTNLGFALTTLGARHEARAELEAGLALAEAIGSSGAVRHAQMNLLGWASVFGNDEKLDAQLSEVRADADAAADEIWTAPDRVNLGTLFYRGVELLRSEDARCSARAALLLRRSATSYRQMGHRDLLPVALGMWAEAERQCGRIDSALALVEEAAALLAEGAPSLLNESRVYLTWHDLLLGQGDERAAQRAIEQGLPFLLVRLRGLVGTPYARQFLTEVPTNAGLLTAARHFDLVPEEVRALLESS